MHHFGNHRWSLFLTYNSLFCIFNSFQSEFLSNGMIGPTLAGFVFDTTGSYYPAWISLGIASLATVFFLLSVPPKKGLSAYPPATPSP